MNFLDGVSTVLCLCNIVPLPKPSELPGLPKKYSDFANVFSKKQRLWPINLLTGTTPPWGRVYPLSIPKSEALSSYIKENLDRRFI